MNRQHAIRSQFDELASDYSGLKQKNSYYYTALLNVFRTFLLQKDFPVLEIGCGTGGILGDISTVPGVGIDMSSEMISIAQDKFPEHRFLCQKLGHIELEETFATICIPDVLEYIDDLNQAFENVRALCSESARVVITTPNPAWLGILNLSSRLGLKMKDRYSRPPSKNLILDAASNCGFRLSHFSTRLLIPKKTFFADWLNLYFQKNKLIKGAGVMMVFVFELS